MHIETWNILLDAVIAVLLVAYGFWLRNVFRHQLASKDSTIENLGAAIKANEAEIARLRAEIAPAITESYERLKKYAELAASESNELANRLKVAESKQTKMDPKTSVLVAASRVRGYLEASVTFRKRVEEVIKSVHSKDVAWQALFDIIVRVAQEFTARIEELTMSLDDEQAKL
jgi:hypothetical protein